MVIPCLHGISPCHAENYPGIFSFGNVSKDGVPRQKVLWPISIIIVFHNFPQFPSSPFYKSPSKLSNPYHQAENTNFEMRVVGEGWKERWGTNTLHNGPKPRMDPEKAALPPNRRVTTTVRGKNIGRLVNWLDAFDMGGGFLTWW